MAEQDSYNPRFYKRVVVKMTGCKGRQKKYSLKINNDMEILVQPFTFI